MWVTYDIKKHKAVKKKKNTLTKTYTNTHSKREQSLQKSWIERLETASAPLHHMKSKGTPQFICSQRWFLSF